MNEQENKFSRMSQSEIIDDLNRKLEDLKYQFDVLRSNYNASLRHIEELSQEQKAMKVILERSQIWEIAKLETAHHNTRREVERLIGVVADREKELNERYVFLQKRILDIEENHVFKGVAITDFSHRSIK